MLGLSFAAQPEHETISVRRIETYPFQIQIRHRESPLIPSFTRLSELVESLEIKFVRHSEKIRIGPAGWSYKDWEGVVYPAKPGTKFDPLAYLADFFDTIEINSSFYGPPLASTTKSWLKRVLRNPKFVFTAKLFQAFTHQRGKATRADEKAFREGMEPLTDAGKLGALLLQFPWSFKNTDDDRSYFYKLLDQFKEYPLVVEVRHVSWNDPRVFESLEERGVGVCNIDQPLFSKSVRPAALTTSPVGYVRLHGRNYQDWFRASAPRNDRYNYLYSVNELDPWIDRIKEIARHTRETYVITNNHFRGKAVVNAIEIKAAVEERAVPAPAPLFAEYERLRESATVSDSGGEPEPGLFAQ